MYPQNGGGYPQNQGQQQGGQQRNSVMVYLKSIFMGKKDNAGRDCYDFTFEPQHAMNLASKLMEFAQQGKTSRISFRTSVKFSQKTQRNFLSGFAVCSEVQPRSQAPQQHYAPVNQGYQQPQAQQYQQAAPQNVPNMAPGAQANRIANSVGPQSTIPPSSSNDEIPF